MLMLSKKFSSKDVVDVLRYLCLCYQRNSHLISRGCVKVSMLMLSKKFSSKYLGDVLRYLCLCYQ